MMSRDVMDQRLTLKSAREERDVGSLVSSNGLEVVVDGRVEASVGKVLLAELLETLAVEGVLEVLKGQSILEDVGIGDLSTLDSGGSRDEASSNDCGNGGLREMHYDCEGIWGIM